MGAVSHLLFEEDHYDWESTLELWGTKSRSGRAHLSSGELRLSELRLGLWMHSSSGELKVFESLPNIYQLVIYSLLVNYIPITMMLFNKVSNKSYSCILLLFITCCLLTCYVFS